MTSSYDVGTVAALMVGIVLLIWGSPTVKLVGVAFLFWRFVLGGCDGVGGPGCGAL